MKTKEDEMKVNKKYLEKVAEAALGMVMPDKKSDGVTRKEQLALAAGISTGIFYVTGGLAELSESKGESPRESAARIIGAALSALPEHRDGLISKLQSDEAEAAHIVVAIER